MILFFTDNNLEILFANSDAISIMWTPSFFDAGTFECRFPFDNGLYSKILSSKFVYRNADITSDNPTETENRDIIHSPMCIESVTVETDREGQKTIIVSGREAKAILERRVELTSTSYRGYADVTLTNVVMRNMTSPKDSRRKVNNLRFQQDEIQLGEYIGEYVTEHKDLLTIFSELCRLGGIGYEMAIAYEYSTETADIKRYFLLKFIQPTNRANIDSRLVFAESINNLVATSWQRDTQNVKNYAIATGVDANGKSRTVEKGLNVFGLDRYEVTEDLSGSYSAGLMSAKLKSTAKSMLQGEESIFAFTIDAEKPFKLGTDYQLGDIVLVSLTGEEAGANGTFGARITAVTYQQTAGENTTVCEFEKVETLIGSYALLDENWISTAANTLGNMTIGTRVTHILVGEEPTEGTTKVNVASSGSSYPIWAYIGTSFTDGTTTAVPLYLYTEASVIKVRFPITFYSFNALYRFDGSVFDVSECTSLAELFHNCTNLKYCDVSTWDTSAVSDISEAFSACSVLTDLDVSGWDTHNVTTMLGTFYGCSSLVSVDLSSWIFNNVTDASQMFSGCQNLETIITGTQATLFSKTFNYTHMFSACPKLKGGNGTTYDSTKAFYLRCNVDTEATPGYFTCETTGTGTAFIESDTQPTDSYLPLSGGAITGALSVAGLFSPNGGIAQNGRNTAWHNKLGMRWTYFEGANTTTYVLPSQYCVVLACIYSANRGVAIAIDWRKSARHIYFNSLHDDTGSYSWTSWVTLK